MLPQKADIISQLQKEIISLQGFKHLASDDSIRPVLGQIDQAFPNQVFPLASIHEFLAASKSDCSATSGFISCLLSSLMNKGGACVWVNSLQTIFPPALKLFGVDPDKIIFITTRNQKELLWLIEEALKCAGLAAVVGEIEEMNFTESRRLQLAVEKSRVTGFLIRNNPGNINTNACTARWKISPIPSLIFDDLPGIGFPAWNIELLKIRNGRPGSWQMYCSNNKFHPVPEAVTSIPLLQQRKTG